MEKYKKTWQRRREEEKAYTKRRYRKARKLAQECADHLRGEYGVSAVHLVGSAVTSNRFHPRSDIDLMVKGLPDEKYFEALKDCWDLLPPGFELDLIPWDDAPEGLMKKTRKKREKLS
ncbi:nucleotidyltransferase domain-containing protein [Candidatus Bipolaricaulota bacterium]|nr:nucleotidyltransferase domain-containing protein [Candidatus Bipolaricaulota bacterium]